MTRESLKAGTEASAIAPTKKAKKTVLVCEPVATPRPLK